MALTDDILSSYPWRCPTVRAYVLLAVQTIFSQITPETTKRQYAEAQVSLSALCKCFEAQAAQQGLFHYQAAHGRLHTCVAEIYLDLSARLTNLAIMHQQAQAPAPKQQLITREGVVVDLEEKIKTNREETDLGTEDSPFDNGSGQ
jgi:hypothetical protein